MKRCQRCNADYPKELEICPYCGHIEMYTEPEPAQTSKPKYGRMTKTILIIVAACFAVILSTVGILVLLNGKNKNQSNYNPGHNNILSSRITNIISTCATPLSGGNSEPLETGAGIKPSVTPAPTPSPSPTPTATPTPTPSMELTEEQAMLAFKYYLIEEVIPSEYCNYPQQYFYWEQESFDGQYCVFYWSNGGDPDVEYSMDITNGDTTSTQLFKSLGEDGPLASPLEIVCDFNAWDYLNSPPSVSSDNSQDIQKYLGADLYESVSSLGYMDSFESELQNKWNSGEYYFGEECQDYWDAGYYTGFSNENIEFWTFDADVGTLGYIFCVSAYSDAYSIYGVKPGMSIYEAVNCLLLNGAYEYLVYYQGFTEVYMNDGNVVRLNCSEGETVSFVDVSNPDLGKMFYGTDLDYYYQE